MKKAVSVGTSAALLASLFTAVVAAPVAASTAVTSAGTIPLGGTSTGTATFTFTETGVNVFPNGGGSLTVTITDSASGNTVHFSGTGTLTAPGSLGASLSVGDNTFTVTTTAQDPNNVEQFSVSGLKIKADTTAATGAIIATMSGSLVAGVTSTTTTATGTLQFVLGTASNLTGNVNVTSTCGFDSTNANGGANFSDASDARNVTVNSGTAPGIQNITFAAGTASHPIGTTVTQTVPNCATTSLASPGTVSNVVFQNVTGTPENVNQGEQNQGVDAFTSITESAAGYIGVGTLTFTLSAAGVQFSAPPTVTVSSGDLMLGTSAAPVSTMACALSFDRMSCSVPVEAASTVASTVRLTNVSLDVASTVASGTAVNVVVTASPAILVTINANTIAYVSRIVVGTAAQPTVFINYNDQSTGLITLTESAAGFFQGGTGANNVLEVCINDNQGETFTRAPYAVVTAGDLKLLNTSTLVGATSVLGTLNADADCATWTVYSASTVASTIEIRGSDSTGAVLPTGANNGPRISVPGWAAPGTVQMAVYTGTGSVVNDLLGLVSNAVRAFKSGVVVTAVSQPLIPAGSPDSLAGNITISETLNGQFKAGERICVVILPRSSNFFFQDTTLKSATTNDLPIITTNTASGLLADPVATPGCANIGVNLVGTPTLTNSFSFQISQQAFGTLGQITISNIHYITTADAPNGAVLVDVAGNVVETSGVEFETTVSNAKIGKTGVADAWIAAGLNVRSASAFGLGTAVVKRGAYVTVRGKSSSSAAGSLVEIWVKTKTTAWHKESSRRVSTDGFVYYSGKVLNLGYRYYRLVFTDGGGTSNTVRAAGK